MQVSKTFLVALLLATICGAPRHLAAQTAAATSATSPTQRPMEGLTAGEVRKVDKAAGRVTIRHERIVNLNMPPMTMVFTVRDKALLDSVQPGDRILFRAEENNGVLTVTEMH